VTYKGTVKNGVVVLDDPAGLPEGAEVRVELPAPPAAPVPASTNSAALARRLLGYAGKAQGLPEDASVNLDHYLYGTPKR
jgi:hypothetical protein